MKRVLLDTSGYSGFMRGRSEIKLALQEAEEILLNPTILGELFAGFMKGKHQKKNERELYLFLDSPRVGMVDINEDTAKRYGIILNSLWRMGTPIPTNDIWIAASAMQYGLNVLTTDRHFLKVQQILVDYFEA